MMVPKKWKKRRSERPSPPPPAVYISPRLGEPPNEEFLAQTEAWLAEAQADYRRQTGDELPGNGVLFVHDVLFDLYGRDASWARFDLGELERFIEKNMPAFAVMLPSTLADLMIFSNYLARTGRFSVEQAIAIQERFFELVHPTLCSCAH